ncbi:MAG: SGNH/GDSL hydrolase family protein, partial [Flavobacteriaceae bacterium]|nr:SGNH/GDSL hydrolase family protein [Flavobacteriaceae bacterium]MBL6679009.1 SGNH/GDSL hydrolase family protein [Flavobacteriaceae bacterium]
MRYLHLLIFILIIGCNDVNESKLKIVFLGDSITEAGVYDKDVGIENNGELIYPKYTGFITFLAPSLAENTELVGKGISGDKVSDLLTRYKKDVIDLDPDIVFIYIGINDVWHKYDFGTGSDIDLYENGLRQIISEIQKIGSRVVLCTPTVIGENHGDFTLANEYVEHYRDAKTMEDMNKDLDAFSDVIRKLSSEYSTDLIDLRRVFLDYISQNNPNNNPSGILTYDGVHLNDQGNKLIADQMINFIN